MEDFSPVHQSEIWQNKKIFSIFTVGGLLKSYNQPKTIIQAFCANKKAAVRTNRTAAGEMAY